MSAWEEISVEEQCYPHPFYGWEGNPLDCPPEHLHELGRCYCGMVRYPYIVWPDLLGVAMREAMAKLLTERAEKMSEEPF